MAESCGWTGESLAAVEFVVWNLLHTAILQRGRLFPTNALKLAVACAHRLEF
jgi:hypothetical protein